MNASYKQSKCQNNRLPLPSAFRAASNGEPYYPFGKAEMKN